MRPYAPVLSFRSVSALLSADLFKYAGYEHVRYGFDSGMRCSPYTGPCTKWLCIPISGLPKRHVEAARECVAIIRWRTVEDLIDMGCCMRKL